MTSIKARFIKSRGQKQRGWRRVLVWFCVVLGGLVGSGVEAATPVSSNHVVMITIDGMRPEFYLPSELSVGTQTLSELMHAGSYARTVYPPYPSFTYPGHTAMVTGDYPARSGITANEVFDPLAAEPRWFWYASDMQVPAIWDAAHAAGLTVGAVSWPVSAGSKSIDWEFPEFTTRPSGFEKFRQYTTPGLLPEIEAVAGSITNAGEMGTGKWDNLIAATAIDIIQRHRPNLLLVHFIESDHAQHIAGRSNPNLPDILHTIDGHIHDIIEATKKAGMYDRTTFIVLGDHGFADIHRMIAPNVLLAQAGLITLDGKKVTDWKAFTQHTGGSAAVYIRDPKDTATLQKVHALLEEHELDASSNRLYRIVEKPELVALGGPRDAAFYLEGELGVMFSGVATGNFFRPATLQGNHGYLPTKQGLQTGLIASGRGIKPGVVITGTRLVDVAPTIAELLGLDLKETDGHPIRQILE
ncbi:MAG TPA: ectonucleotide pyrophosphatase/phosphodiesterase [Verrucomicrobiae bacterium]|nr:ectonucleotide pyrophosphatase/phosphodiesterase [Verrucomicrobiae bacterium]